MQKILFNPLFFILITFASASQARVPIPEFQDQDVVIDVLPGARVFEANIGPVHVIGADVGPRDGIPLVLINGYSSNFPYLAPFIKKLNERNFRVFVYNPPGQGRGLIASGNNMDKELHGINGMLVAVKAVVEYAYKTSDNHPVVLVGHSLGGMQARLGSLGVIDSHEMQAHVHASSRKAMKNKLALIVPMFSPPLHDLENNIKNKAAEAKALSRYLPYLLKHREWLAAVTPFFYQSVEEYMTRQFVIRRQNAELRGIFGSPNLDTEALLSVFKYLNFSNIRIEPQIAADLQRWVETGVVNTQDGFDLATAWNNQQTNPDQHVPTFYIAGTHDNLVDIDSAKKEAAHLNSKILVVDTGHVGAYYDKIFADQMANAIVDEYHATLKCNRLLK